MDTKYLILIIYLIGFIWSYFIFKKVRNELEENEWRDVKYTILVSLFSCGFVIIWYTILLSKFIENKLQNTKPPKWL